MVKPLGLSLKPAESKRAVTKPDEEKRKVSYFIILPVSPQRCASEPCLMTHLDIRSGILIRGYELSPSRHESPYLGIPVAKPIHVKNERFAVNADGTSLCFRRW